MGSDEQEQSCNKNNTMSTADSFDRRYLLSSEQRNHRPVSVFRERRGRQRRTEDTNLLLELILAVTGFVSLSLIIFGIKYFFLR